MTRRGRDRITGALLGPAGALARLQAPAPLALGPAHALDVTTAIRPPPELAARLLAELAPLRAAHPEHHWYPAASLHVTVLNLNELSYAGLEPAAIDRLAGRAAAGAGRFEVELDGGLHLSRSTLLVACSAGAGLHRLRARLRRVRREAAGSAHGNAGDALKRTLVHLTVARLGRRPDGSLRRDAAALHAALAGLAFTAQAVELLRTDRACSPAATTVLGRYPLG